MLGFLFPSVPSPKSREKFVGTASPATFLAKGRKGRRPRQLFSRKDARDGVPGDGVPGNFSRERTQGTASPTTFLAKGRKGRRPQQLFLRKDARDGVPDNFSCERKLFPSVSEDFPLVIPARTAIASNHTRSFLLSGTGKRSFASPC